MRILLLLAVSGAIAMFTGCSTVESRIRDNQALFDALPESQRSLVVQGKVAEGMPKRAVYMAWGRPLEVAHGSMKGRRFEEWRYFIYWRESIPAYASVPVWTREGRFFLDYVYDPIYVTHRRPWRRAVFEKDAVISWESVHD